MSATTLYDPVKLFHSITGGALVTFLPPSNQSFGIFTPRPEGRRHGPVWGHRIPRPFSFTSDCVGAASIARKREPIS